MSLRGFQYEIITRYGDTISIFCPHTNGYVRDGAIYDNAGSAIIVMANKCSCKLEIPRHQLILIDGILRVGGMESLLTYLKTQEDRYIRKFENENKI